MKSSLLFMMVSLYSMTIFATETIKTQFPKKSETFIWSSGDNNWILQNTFTNIYDSKGNRLSTRDYSNIDNQYFTKDTVIYQGDIQKEKIEYKWDVKLNQFLPTTKSVYCTETLDYFCGSEIFNFDDKSKSWILNSGTKNNRIVSQNSRTMTMTSSDYNNILKKYELSRKSVLIYNENNQVISETEYNYDTDKNEFIPNWRTTVLRFTDSGAEAEKNYEAYRNNKWNLERKYTYYKLEGMNFFRTLYLDENPQSKLLGRIAVYNDDESYSDTYDTLRGENELRIKFEKRRNEGNYYSTTYLYDETDLRKIIGYDEESQKFNEFGMLTQQLNISRDTLNNPTINYGLKYEYIIDNKENITEIVTKSYEKSVDNFINSDRVVYSDFDNPTSIENNDFNKPLFRYNQSENSINFYSESHISGVLKLIDISGRTITSLIVDTPLIVLPELSNGSYIAYYFGEAGSNSVKINISK